MPEPIRPPKLPVELVAMLAPRTFAHGKPFGGQPDLTDLDVAAALGAGGRTPGSKLTPLQSTLALARVAQDANALEPLAEEAYQFARWVATDRGWQFTQHRHLYALAVRAVAEIAGNNRCAKCRGTGQVPTDRGVRVDCNRCDGTGRGVAYIACSRCDGQGWKQGTERDCIKCKGSGVTYERSAYGGRCIGSGTCNVCSGTGKYKPTIHCRACGGDAKRYGRGIRPITGRQMASLMGVSHVQWEKTWSPRLDVLVGLLESELAHVNNHLAHQLRRGGQ